MKQTLLCLIVIVTWGLWAFLNNSGVRKIGALNALSWAFLATIVLNLAMLTWCLAHGARFDWSAGGYFPVLGTICASVGFVTWMYCMGEFKGSIVIVLTSLYPALSVALNALVWKERLKPATWVGVGMALVAGVLLSMEGKD